MVLWFCTEFVINKTSKNHTVSLHHNKHCYPLPCYSCPLDHGSRPFHDHHDHSCPLSLINDHHGDQPELIILVVITCWRCSRPPGSISRWWRPSWLQLPGYQNHRHRHHDIINLLIFFNYLHCPLHLHHRRWWWPNLLQLPGCQKPSSSSPWWLSPPSSSPSTLSPSSLSSSSKCHFHESKAMSKASHWILQSLAKAVVGAIRTNCKWLCNKKNGGHLFQTIIWICSEKWFGFVSELQKWI